MPIDSSVYQLAGRGVKSVADYDAEYSQSRQNKLAESLGTMKLQDHQRGLERQNALRGVLGQTYAAPEDRESALLRGGFLEEATKLGKDRRDNAKTDAETQAKNFEAAHKRMEAIGQGTGWLKDNPTMENAQSLVNHWRSLKIMSDAEAQQKLADFARDPTPQGIAKLATMGYQAALSAKDQLPKIETRNLGGTTDTLSISPITGKASTINSVQNTQSPESIASQATARRGQDMVDARSRDATSAAMSKPFEITGADGNPVLVQQDKQGNIRPVQGYTPKQGASKPLTDSQAKANLFGSRMQESHRILNELEGKYSPMAVNAKMAAAEVPGVGGAAGYAGNLMLSTEGQQAEQAQRDFINAVLRRESGAVISPQEFSNGQKQYFPQPGDDKKTLDQKRRNRALAIQGMNVEVPGGLRSAPALTNPGSTGGADGGWSIQKVN